MCQARRAQCAGAEGGGHLQCLEEGSLRVEVAQRGCLGPEGLFDSWSLRGPPSPQAAQSQTTGNVKSEFWVWPEKAEDKGIPSSLTGCASHCPSFQVEQMFALTPVDPAGDIDYKSLCYIITHGDEKEE